MNRYFFTRFLLVLGIFTLQLSSTLFAAEVKDEVDKAIRFMRSMQNEDGSYGNPADAGTVTPVVLMAFTTSPRHYSDLDGPFVRRAVEWLTARQTSDGFFKTGVEKSPFNETALSLGAIASVNRSKWAGSLTSGWAYILQQYTDKENWTETGHPAGGNLFYLALALKLSHPEGLNRDEAMGSPTLSGQDPDWIFKAAWMAAIGWELPETFHLTGLVNDMEKALKGVPFSRTRKGSDDPLKALEGAERIPVTETHLWAGIYLLTLLDGNNTVQWVESLAEPMMTRLSTAIQKDGESNLMGIASLTNTLSLFYGRDSAPSPPQAEPEASLSPIVGTPRSVEDAVSEALGFLEKNQQEGRFGFSGFPDPGITALAVSSAIRGSRMVNRQEPSYVAKSLTYLKDLQKEDGSIYQHGLANYVTSVSIMAFIDAGDPQFEPAIEAARTFLVILQADEDEGYSLEEDTGYGGLGYGGDERPDLSNTQMSLEALKASGLEDDHAAFRKAVLFLQRCQNLSEVNPTRVQMEPGKKVISANDGGGIYAPGTSKADLEEIGEGIFVARSYGSMTYALLKSYLFAGLDPEDKRVRAAVAWIKANYTLEENPGFKGDGAKELGQQGLYYYYLTMARALDALDLETIVTPDGKSHVWRKELKDKMLALQRNDGSWLNHRSPRWFEGNPVLATAYALLVLDVCRQK